MSIAIIRPGIPREADGGIGPAIDARDEIVRSSGVLISLDSPPDSPVFGLTLHALGLGKYVCIRMGEDGSCGELWMAWRSAPVFGGCTEEEAVVLTEKLIEHDQARLIRGQPWAHAWVRELQKCESPIEERLLLHVYSKCGMECSVTAQLPVATQSGDYRIDIAVHQEAYDETPAIKIAVEADGHDFHERTKEQARRDKSRDRALTLAGWTVMRFTGSEIWKDANACAEQVAALRKKLEGHEE